MMTSGRRFTMAEQLTPEDASRPTPERAREALRQPTPGTEAGQGSPVGMPPIEKVVIAIHGIGSQRRSDTIRSVARRFGDMESPPLPVMPLGFFSLGNSGVVRASRLDVDPKSDLAKVGFAEVFWADIPRQVVKAEDTLEETKAWGATVVSRARAAYVAKVPKGRRLGDVDFRLCAGVIEEIVETITVLENLLFVFKKMGILKFDLAPLLRDYIGDVQIVTEFKYYRERIVARFHSAMAQILEAFPAERPKGVPEIYVVAHSEGTVVSFIGMLQAMSGTVVCDPDTPKIPISTDWIKCVRGFMTIGSPIDKHLVLWEKLWEELDLASTVDKLGAVAFTAPDGRPRLELSGRIEWRNYYDFGDPIGFELSSAREFLAKRKCAAFDFSKDDDFGFSRYLLPGKAHNDYWGDADVFGHFINDVVMRARKAEAPKSKAGVGLISTFIPYLLAAALHVGGVFLLFKAVTTYLNPATGSAITLSETVVGVLILALLLYCSTVAARLPRLVKTSAIPSCQDAEGGRWHLLALVIFCIGAVSTWLWLPDDLGGFLGNPLADLAGSLGFSRDVSGKTALVVAAALIGLSGWVAPRQPGLGRRFLLGCGVLIVLAMIAGHIIASDAHAKLWPLVLGGLAFIYLWWLGILLFDLAFVWHRYIRQSVAVRAIADWNRGRDVWPSVTLRRRPAATAPHAGKTASKSSR
jgi:hypothetical protein